MGIVAQTERELVLFALTAVFAAVLSTDMVSGSRGKPAAVATASIVDPWSSPQLSSERNALQLVPRKLRRWRDHADDSTPTP